MTWNTDMDAAPRQSHRIYFAMGDGILSAIILFGCISVVVVTSVASLHVMGFWATTLLPTALGALFFGVRRYYRWEANHDPE